MKFGSPLLVGLVGILACFGAYFLGFKSGRANRELTQPRKSIEVGKQIEKVQSTSNPVEEILDVHEIFNRKDSIERTYEFHRFLKSMTANDALTVLEQLNAMRPSQKRKSMLGQFFSRWGELSGDMALVHALKHKGSDGLLLQSSAIEGWASFDPGNAWSALMEISNYGAIAMPKTGLTLVRIAERDLSLAVDLSQEIENPAHLGSFISSLADYAAESDQTPQLLQEIQQVENSDQKVAMLETLFENWGQSDNESSLAAAYALNDEMLVASAMKGLMKGWAESDGKGALEYAIQNLEDPLFREISVSVAKDWAMNANSTEVEEIFSVVEKAPNSRQILENVIHPLAQANPDRALQLVETIDHVSTKGRNTAMVLMNQIKTAPEAAEAYFRSIPDDEVRRYSTPTIVRNAIDSGQSIDEVMSIMDAFTTDEWKTDTLSTIAWVAYQDENFHKTEELRNELSSRIEETDNFDPAIKQEMLDRLKSRNP